MRLLEIAVVFALVCMSGCLAVSSSIPTPAGPLVLSGKRAAPSDIGSQIDFTVSATGRAADIAAGRMGVGDLNFLGDAAAVERLARDLEEALAELQRIQGDDDGPVTPVENPVE